MIEIANANFKEIVMETYTKRSDIAGLSYKEAEEAYEKARKLHREQRLAKIRGDEREALIREALQLHYWYLGYMEDMKNFPKDREDWSEFEKDFARAGNDCLEGRDDCFKQLGW